MAEGVLRSLLAGRGIDASQVRIDSAGTHDFQVGKPPFALAIQSAKGRGYEIEQQLARRVTPQDFDDFDHILAMDRNNLAHLRSICPTRCKQKIELLLEYGDRHHGKEVPDPYGGQPRDFERALDMIEDGCRGFVQILARR
jgi:low molecular weight protein-tyrosine phosphatase